MTIAESVYKQKSVGSIAIACEIDQQEIHFDSLVKLWVDDEISYDFLLENYPTYETSMIRKILTYLRKLFI